MASTYYMTADADPGGVGTIGDPWDITEFEQWVEGSAAPNPPAAVPGDICYVESGSYTLTSDIITTAINGTAAARIRAIGVTDLNNPTTTGAVANDRPLFACNNNIEFQVNDLWTLGNLRLTGNTAGYLLKADTSSIIVNCKAENAGAGVAIILGAQFARAIRCEAACATGIALRIASYSSKAIDCILRDSATGILQQHSYTNIINCLIHGCTLGLDADSGSNTVDHVTFYECDTAIAGAAGLIDGTFISNIFSECPASAVFAGATDSNYWDYNDWHNSGAPVNVTKGTHALAVDPKFVNAAGGDFRVQAASLLNVGLNPAAIGAIQQRFGPMRHPSTCGGASG